MRAVTARATRRDLRRAMGDSGIDMLARQQAFIASQVVPQINIHQERLEDQARQIASLHEQRIREEDIRPRTFWQRVRWLVRG